MERINELSDYQKAMVSEMIKFGGVSKKMETALLHRIKLADRSAFDQDIENIRSLKKNSLETRRLNIALASFSVRDN
jgi:hypothetical protein